MSVALVDRDRAEKLTRSLVTESVNAFDVVVQHCGHDVINRLQQGLKWAYSTMLVTCIVEFTRVSRMVATSIRWNGERSGGDEESELAESRAGEVQQDERKLLGPVGLVNVLIPVDSCC